MELDGNLVDMATVCVGAVSALAHPLKRWLAVGKPPYFTTVNAVMDRLSGAMVVPFLLMVGSVFSSKLLNALLGATKITVAIGGCIGLMFVLGELFKERP